MFEQMLMLYFCSVIAKIRKQKQLRYYNSKDYLKVEADK